MTTGAWALAAWAGFFTLAWCALALFGLRAGIRFKTLRELEAPRPAAWPRLSVIVAACDEAETIGPALRTLLAGDYPDLEVVVVNDRSKDATGRIVDEAAAADPRVRPVHVGELPPGWLGKVHALHRGVAEASGSWMLFTDADVHFAPGALRHAVAHAVGHGIDHLAVAPDIVTPHRVQEIVSAAFVTCFLAGTRATDVASPRSDAFVGVGAFNLVRREMFARTPGFEWLRLEILDDVGLGLMMKRAGARCEFAIGLGDVVVTWYPTFRAMARGLEKNLFGSICHYRLDRLAAYLLGTALLLPAPFLALGLPRPPWLAALGGIALALTFVDAALFAIRTRRSFVSLLLAPAGGLLLALLVVRSAWRCLRDRGVTWRGTFYPLGGLREGQRVKLW